MTAPAEIAILVTGGTFDKEYDDINGRLYFKNTHVEEILRLGRANLPIQVRTLMMLDSLDMTANDREHIANECASIPQQKIVITHGTDTMVITAELLNYKKLDKTIVLTGAMIPYKFGSSDGLFNLGSAIAFCQTLPSGVYVAMNGRYFPAGEVHKNRSTGFFEPMKE